MNASRLALRMAASLLALFSASCSSGSTGVGALPDGGTRPEAGADSGAPSAGLSLESCTLTSDLPTQDFAPLAAAADGSALYWAGGTPNAVYRYAVQPGSSCQLALDASFGQNGVLAMPPTSRFTDFAVDSTGGVWINDQAGGTGVERIWPGAIVTCGAAGSIALKADASGGYIFQEVGGSDTLVPFAIASGACTLSPPVTLTGPSLESVQVARLDAAGHLVVAGSASPTASPLSPIEIFDVTGPLIAESQPTTDSGDPYDSVQSFTACGAGICASGAHSILRFADDGSFVGSSSLGDPVVGSLAAGGSKGFVEVQNLSVTSIQRFSGF